MVINYIYMLTPYQILQLKQKQRKKIITQSKQQRSFSVRYDKNGQNATEYFMEKDKRIKRQKMYRNKSEDQTHVNGHAQQKKYEIIFRQSIRKVNVYRTNVYHTHNAIRNEKFINRFLTTRENQSPKNTTDKPQNNIFSKTVYSRFKTSNADQKLETLSMGKYKIFLMSNKQKSSINQAIPEISVEKCKINLNVNQNKEKIQKAIQSLYDHQKTMENTIRKGSLDSYLSEKNTLSEQNQRGKHKQIDSTFKQFKEFKQFKQYKQLKQLKQSQQKNETRKNVSHTSQIKNKIRLIQETDGQIQSCFNHQTIDDLKVANFIKNKKKKRLPISLLKPKSKDGQLFYFRRTTTDQLAANPQRHNFLKGIQERYFSPNKKSRCVSKIKFNSIQENLSGWQFLPCQTQNLHPEQNIAKINFLSKN